MSIPSSSGGSLTELGARPRFGPMLGFGATLPLFGAMLVFFGATLAFFAGGALEARSGGFEGLFAGGFIDARFGCFEARFSTATFARGT